MTAYTYNSLPDEMTVKPVSNELFPKAKAAFLEAFDSEHIEAQTIHVAYAYERHGHMDLDRFGGARNNSYSSERDDLVIQVTVRIPNPKGYAALPKMVALETAMMEEGQAAERKALEDAIAADEAKAKQANANAVANRAKLEALNSK